MSDIEKEQDMITPKRPMHLDDDEEPESIECEDNCDCDKCCAWQMMHWTDRARANGHMGPVAGKSPMSKKSNNIFNPIDVDDQPVGAVDIDLCGDGDDDDMTLLLPKKPDLRWFFQQYNLDERSQIAICRTHANHLAAMTRVDKPKHRETKKKLKFTE